MQLVSAYTCTSEKTRQFKRFARVCIPLICAALSACADGPAGMDTGSQSASYIQENQYEDMQIVDSLPPPPNTNQGKNELIAVNDLLEIDVFQVDELDRTTEVDSNGRISLPLIGTIEAKGKTISELETELKNRYGAKYLQNPEISVFMKESAGQRVTVDGQVRKPGIYPVSSNATLLQVIAQAGGFQDIADESKLYVFREFGDKKLVANYNVSQIRTGKQQDPRIFGGDVIVSFASGTKIAARNLREALGIASSAVWIGAL